MRKSSQRVGSFQEAYVRILLERPVFFFKSVMGRGAIDSEYDQRRASSLQKAAAADGFIVWVCDKQQDFSEIVGFSVHGRFR